MEPQEWYRRMDEIEGQILALIDDRPPEVSMYDINDIVDQLDKLIHPNQED